MSTIVTRSGKGSPLSHDEVDANFTNLNTDKLQNIVEDTTPQLGGNLDAQTYSISNVSNIEIENTASINTIVGTGSGGIGAAPRLPNGIDLDGSGIVSSHDGSYQRVDITGGLDITNGASGVYNSEFINTSASGSGLLSTVGVPGNVVTGGQLITGRVSTSGGYATRFNVDYLGKVTINGAYSLPTADGTANQVLATNGSGQLSFVTGGGGSGITDLVQDTTPQLGGNLDVNGNSIISVSNANIAITPNGTGRVILDGVSWPSADGTAGQAITTDGSGSLSFTTISGGSGIENLVEDTTPQLGGELDVNGASIRNSVNNYTIVGDTVSTANAAVGSTALARSYGVLSSKTVSGWTGSNRVFFNPEYNSLSLGASITGGTGRVSGKLFNTLFDLNSYNLTTSNPYGAGLNMVNINEPTLNNTGGTAATLAQHVGLRIGGGVYSEGDNITVTNAMGLYMPIENYTENTGNTITTQYGIRLDYTDGDDGFTGPTNQYSIHSNSSTAKMVHSGPVQIGAYTLPTVDGLDGYVLTTDGEGVVSWSAGGGGGGGSFDGNLAGDELQDATNSLITALDPIKIITDTSHSASVAGLEINLAKPIDGYPIYVTAANNESVGDDVGGVLLDYRKLTSAVTGSNPRLQIISDFRDVPTDSTTTPTQTFGINLRTVFYNSSLETPAWNNRTRQLIEFGSDGFYNSSSGVVSPANQKMNFGVNIDSQEGGRSGYISADGGTAFDSVLNGAGAISRNLSIDYDIAVDDFNAIADTAWTGLSTGTYSANWDPFWGFGQQWRCTVTSTISDYMTASSVVISKAFPPATGITGPYGTVVTKYNSTPAWASSGSRTVTMTRPASGTTFYQWTIEYLNNQLFIRTWDSWTVV